VVEQVAEFLMMVLAVGTNTSYQGQGSADGASGGGSGRGYYKGDGVVHGY